MYCRNRARLRTHVQTAGGGHLQDLEGRNSRELEPLSRGNVSQKCLKNAMFRWSPAADGQPKVPKRMIDSLRFSLAALCVGLTVCAANAADVEAEPPANGYDWSGFYLGAHVGDGEADSGGNDNSDPTPNDLKLDGIVGGAQAGFNWQIDNFVLGAEGDVS